MAGDESAAIGDFRQFNFGAYVQDAIQITDRFKLTVGVRVDAQIWPDDQPENSSFNEETIPMIEADTNNYDLQGAEIGNFIEPQFSFSPPHWL